jgi:phosphoribosylaminoimidazole-succinocarboxamide synthase
VNPAIPATVWQTELAGVQLRSRGKVRDMYEVGDALLMVASDRLSAFDVVLPTPIPDKGRVLTQLSLFWFDLLREVLPNHVISATEFPGELEPHRAQISGRSILVRKTEPLPVECVVRGYLSGSGWKDYKVTGSVCGIALPSGLQDSSQLPEPIFTPATKATTGHDENISFAQASDILGAKRAAQAREVSLEIYRRASQYARERGIIIADTKFEFGIADGALVWIDEALTPDSSRFWPAAGYAPGRGQPSFDKQFVRDYLERIGWNKQPPGPELPPDVVAGTRGKYREAYRLVTGKELS